MSYPIPILMSFVARSPLYWRREELLRLADGFVCRVIRDSTGESQKSSGQIRPGNASNEADYTRNKPRREDTGGRQQIAQTTYFSVRRPPFTEHAFDFPPPKAGLIMSPG